MQFTHAFWSYWGFILNASFLYYDELLVGPSILWLGVSNRTQLIMGTSGHMVTWCSMVKLSASTRAQYLGAATDGTAILQNPRGLYCALLLGLALNSTLSATEPITVPGCTRNWQPPMLPRIWARVMSKGVEFVLLEPNVTYQASCFIVVGDARYRSLSFTLEGMSPHITDYGTSKNFTEVADPWTFNVFISHPLNTCILSRPLAYKPSLACPTHQYIIGITHWYDVL